MCESYDNISFCTTGVTLGFVQPEVNIFENQSHALVCIAITNVPIGGLECDVEATIEFGGLAKTCKFHRLKTLFAHVMLWAAVQFGIDGISNADRKGQTMQKSKRIAVCLSAGITSAINPKLHCNPWYRKLATAR